MSIQWSALTELRWMETRSLGQAIEFGCAPLAPADFAEHGAMLADYIAAAVKTAMEQAEAEAAGREYTETARAPSKAEIQTMQVIVCLTVRKARSPGGTEENCAFVLNQAQESEQAHRIWVGRLPMRDIALIASSGIGKAMDAARRAAGFRDGRPADVDAGRDGKAVQPDTGPVAPAC